MRHSTRKLAALALPLAMVAAACGGGGGGDSSDDTEPPPSAVETDGVPDTTAAPVTTAAPATTSAPGTTTPAVTTVPEGEISNFADVQPAVIQIVAQGSIRDPEVGQSTQAGSGSGFIISPDGLAVTNNHVVTGAATLEVFVGGDTSESYNAQVIGVSECNDLALIDINESEPLPTLDWYEGEITAGTDVYVAGFPLGDPEFTLTSGIIAKAEAGGDLTGTSSIDHTLEHDAVQRPGNSGGPLVTEDGKVIAVNYAGGGAENTEQFFSIASDLAQPVIEELRNGDFESIGINGWAVFDEAAGITGIWVAGVEPGSPAADAEILAGDIVTSMNGLPVGTDGTFKDYCDVIRTAGEDNPIQVEVLRFDTSEVLRGEINGDQPIELAFSFADEVGEEVGEATGTTAPPAADTYEPVTDDTGSIVVEVPAAWAARDTTPIVLDDGTEIPYIAAAPDLDGFLNSYDVPGLIFRAQAFNADVAAVLAEVSFAEDCTDAGVTDYSDAVFTGQYQIWQDCAGTPNDVVTLAANPADQSITAVIVAGIVTDADVQALDQAFATFNIVAG